MGPLRGLQPDEQVRSWHGRVITGHTGGLFSSVVVLTTKRRRYNVRVDIYGQPYATDGRTAVIRDMPVVVTEAEALADLARLDAHLRGVRA